MGGTAHSLTVGLAAPPDLPVQWALDLADGIAEEAALVGASIVGGDLTTAKEVVVAITVMGTCEVAPVLRSGAQPGDVVAMAGPAGLGRRGAGRAGSRVPAPRGRSSRPTSVPSRRTPPGSAAAHAGATAMIDVSDGLVADAGHIAADSGVAIDIDRRRVRARRADAAPSAPRWVSTRCSSSSVAATTTRSSRPSPPAPTCPRASRAIGSVAEPGEAGAVVTVDGAAYDGPAGWSHF